MFDRETAKKLHREIDDMARQIAEKYGYEFKPGSARFSDTEISFGFYFRTTNASGETQFEADYKQHAKTFDLDPDWLHKIIQEGDKKMEIIGLDLNKTKNVVILKEISSGKQYIAPAITVKLWMKYQTGG